MSAKYKFHLSGARFYQFVVMLMVCFCFFQSKAQWAFVGSPESCDPISFDSEGDTLVVITTGGLFYSQNTGTTWHAIKTPEVVCTYKEIQIEQGHLYLTTYRNINANRKYELYRSDDWGATWVMLPDPPELTDRILQWVINADTCYYITPTQIYISHDRGDHFSPGVPGLGTYSYYDFHHDRLYAKVSGEDQRFLLRTSDEGLTWDTLDKTIDHTFISDVASIDGALWSIKFYNGSHYCNILKSTDDGDSWIIAGTIEDLQQGFFDRMPRQILGSQGQMYVIAEGSNQTIYHSADGGRTWIEVIDVSGEMDIFYGNNRLFFSSYTGLYRSADHGETRERLTTGLEAATVDGIALSGSSIWTSNNTQMHVLKSGHSDWETLDGYYEVKATRDGHLLSIVDQQAFVSADAGAHWTEVTAEDLGLDFASMHYAMCAGDMMYISTAFYELFYSQDYGATWHLSDISYAYNLNYNGKYVIEVDSEVLTSDDGIHWRALPNPVHPDFHFFIDFVYWMDPYYFIGSNNLVLRLHQDSTAWEEVIEPASVLSDPNVSMLGQGDVLFVTVYGAGVFGSTDFGDTWYPIHEGLTNLKTITLSKDYDDLYLGTDGGVWKRPLHELVTGLASPAVYPKVSSDCVITEDLVSLELPETWTGEQHIQIYSTDGRLMYMGHVEPGATDVYLDRYPSGMYYVIFSSAGGREVRRVIKL